MPRPSATRRSDRPLLRQTEILRDSSVTRLQRLRSADEVQRTQVRLCLPRGRKLRSERVSRTRIGDGNRKAPLGARRGFERVQLWRCSFSFHEVLGYSVRVIASASAARCRTGSLVKISEWDIRVTGA